MDEQEKERRDEIARAANESIEMGDATGWFEELYKQADGDIDQIPWADLVPNRFLVEWDRGEKLEGTGKNALVIGCGLGDEARYLAERGFNVTAFDISAKAIEWAKQISEDTSINFLVADLFEPPDKWKNAFDLIVEVYTIQALPLSFRDKTIDAISGFLADEGKIVVVQRLRADDETDPPGPPWALSRKELNRFEESGLKREDFQSYMGDEEEPIQRFVAQYRKKTDG
jgi:SAM-dependent methyltransferase